MAAFSTRIAGVGFDRLLTPLSLPLGGRPAAWWSRGCFIETDDLKEFLPQRQWEWLRFTISVAPLAAVLATASTLAALASLALPLTVAVSVTVPVAVAISVVIVVSALAGLAPVVAGLAVGILRHGNKSLMVVGSTRWKWLSLWARYLASCRRMLSLEQGGHYSDPRRSLAGVCKYEARAFPDGPFSVRTEYPRMGGNPSCLPASV